MTRDYEIMLILKTDLNDEAVKEVVDKISNKIKELEGEIKTSSLWAKEKNFFFPIRSRGAEKKKFMKGCYWLISFILDSESLLGLKELLRLEERILRNLIINAERKSKLRIDLEVPSV